MMRQSKIRMNTQLSAWLISLVLLFGFPPSVSATNTGERQSPATEWILGKPISNRRANIYKLGRHCTTARKVRLCASFEIIRWLKTYARHIATRIFESFRQTYLIESVQSKHVSFAYCSANFKG